MPEIAIMIEGQNGLNWQRWKGITRLVEDLGFAGLFRSDHYTNMNPPDKDSLELWVSLTWLADNTQRIEFGPLVSPVSFRHPTMTARMGAAVDDLSDGRLILGVGAGWQEREHNNYGWELLDVPGRFRRFEEGLEVVTRLLQSDEPFDFAGEYYRMNEAILLPRPARAGGPPIAIGGNGYKRTLPLAARYADEWNAIFISSDQFADLNQYLDGLIAQQGRGVGEVKRSMMTGCEFGLDEAEVVRKVEARTKGKFNAKELRERGMIVGTPGELVEQLGRLEEAGAYRVMLQWLDLDDLDGLEALAKTVLPQMA